MVTVIFCGGDGKGKTTIAKKLALQMGKPYFKFPYGSDNDTEEFIYSGREIREILNDKETPCRPSAHQAIQFANKLEGIPVLLELEKQHGVVFVDRWWISTYVYGTVDGVDREWNKWLNSQLAKLITPTIVFIFTGTSFKKDKDIYGEKQIQIDKLYEEYYESRKDCKRIKYIKVDVTGKTEDKIAFEVLSEVMKIVLPNTVNKSSNTELQI